MCTALPSEVWELILSRGGPLKLCDAVGAAPERVGAARLQRWVREHTGHDGDVVDVRLGDGRWLRGTLLYIGSLTGVQVGTTPRRYIFMQHRLVRVRRASDETRIFLVHAAAKSG